MSKKKKENPDVVRSFKEISIKCSKRMVGSYFSGTRMQHSYIAMYVLENILINLRPKKIVELGARWGGTTSFFGVWAAANNAQFLSLDLSDHLRDTAKRLLNRLKPNVELRYENDFNPTCIEYIKHWIGDDKSLIYCDGGDKTREIDVYSKFLTPGSIIACHDYVSAVRPEDVSKIAKREHLKPILNEKQLAELSSRQQFWIKK